MSKYKTIPWDTLAPAIPLKDYKKVIELFRAFPYTPNPQENPMSKKTPTPRKIKVATPLQPPVSCGTFKVTDLKLKPRAGRTSIYATAMTEISKLKRGEGHLIRIPKDSTYSIIRNRMVSALRNSKMTVPEGCTFVHRQTEDGQHLAVVAQAIAKAK